jgi:ribulose-phosphate 3-epimerase
MEIIPSINVQTFDELKKKLALVEHLVSWAHLDIADGTFTQHATWNNPEDLKLLNTKLNLEAHLMVKDVEKKLAGWLVPKVKRIFFHLNATGNADFVIDRCIKAGIEPAIAIGPDEPLKFIEKVKTYQILGVEPGPAGQIAEEKMFERIREMWKICPSCIIEADGGMNSETAKKAREAGADIIVAASYIFNSNNIEETIHALE